MSLFSNLGNGDIWALSGISFASPVNDLLDKGEFTLEDLLEEDELIQEVKSKNERLIEFLIKDRTIDHLLDFIIYPAYPADTEKRTYKYPYMSCEVICCEIPEILKTLVESCDGFYLKKLFSFLSINYTLDCYLAGYFEKILEMLFRRMTVAMMKYFNSAGLELLELFLNHIDNYSIMQIVQRLMLPHIPFISAAEMESICYDDIKEYYQCNWSYLSSSCSSLFLRMFDPNNADIPLHISDLLITVLQLSPPETLIIKFLCQDECITKLLDSIVAENADMAEVSDPFNVNSSISLASISVLESLISRLFEASLPFENASGPHDVELENENLQKVKESIDAICILIEPYLSKMDLILKSYLGEKNPCSKLRNQTKNYFPRLGHRGLQLIKFMESLNRLSNPLIDASFCTNGLFKTCIDLFIYYDSNSLLHLSVQRIFTNIIESDFSRREAQKNLLIDCDLLHIVIEKIGKSIVNNPENNFNVFDSNKKKNNIDNNNNINSSNNTNFNKASNNEQVDVDLDSYEEHLKQEDSVRSFITANDFNHSISSVTYSNSNSCLSRHSSLMGNLILIAQSLSLSLEISLHDITNNSQTEEEKELLEKILLQEESDYQNNFSNNYIIRHTIDNNTQFNAHTIDSNNNNNNNNTTNCINDNNSNENNKKSFIYDDFTTFDSSNNIANITLNSNANHGIMSYENGDSNKVNENDSSIQLSEIDIVVSEVENFYQNDETNQALENQPISEFEDITNKNSKQLSSIIDGNIIAEQKRIKKEQEDEEMRKTVDEIIRNYSEIQPTIQSMQFMSPISNPSDLETSSNQNNLRSIFSHQYKNSLNDWEAFYCDKLRPILDRQLLGTYQPNPNLIAQSPVQDDPSKLGIDLDLFQLSDVNYFKNRFKSSNKEIQNENKHNTNINININDDDDDWDYFERVGDHFSMHDDFDDNINDFDKSFQRKNNSFNSTQSIAGFEFGGGNSDFDNFDTSTDNFADFEISSNTNYNNADFADFENTSTTINNEVFTMKDDDDLEFQGFADFSNVDFDAFQITNEENKKELDMLFNNEESESNNNFPTDN